MEDFKWSSLINPLIMLALGALLIPTLMGHSTQINQNTSNIALLNENVQHIAQTSIKPVEINQLCETTAVLKAEVKNLSKALDRLERMTR